ncbi:acyltransferase family protein [Rouxiella sp. S1S-2]|uniref:acyltransferase family protein n=1 Tax=Rouxiella sp. S1S-2 TaxID=2653856 RepID=UPI00186B5888|nr:acyltransferase family protein [Rouxiella sp. S1S-2]
MKNKTIDSLKLIFAVTVVAMHGFLLDSQYNRYILGVFTNGFFRSAVPFFFIVSGYLFFKTIKKNTTKKWFSHIIKVYLIWSIIYAYKLSAILQIENASVLRKIYLIIRAEITGAAQLWFIPALIITALLCLLLKNAIQCKPKVMLVFISILWIIGVLLNWRFVIVDSPNSFFYRNGIFYGMPMFFLGYLIASNEWVTANFNGKLKALLLLAIIFSAYESLAWTKFINDSGSHFITSMDMTFSAPFLSTILFLLCLRRPGIIALSGIERLTSTFMYYSHILFLDGAYLVLAYCSKWIGVNIPLKEMATIAAVLLIITSCFFFQKTIKRLV